MIALGIETSCDETSCAILENGNKLRSNIISSSLAKHQPFGGVVPEIASRHSLEAIDLVYQTALRVAKVKQSQIDLIAVTQGPGLVGSLLVGISFAKALGFSLGKPVIGVQHLKAHLEANFISHPRPTKPFIGLVVSGGHTSIIRVKGFRYEEIGSTVDDAIGEAYDKSAKILGLGYPGGPIVDRLAQQGNPSAFKFTKPKVNGMYDFSFSGIKTAVLHAVCGTNGKIKPPVKLSDQKLKDLCASFQFLVTEWVLEKTLLACENYGIKSLAIGGGVSANSRLRARFQEECQLRGIQLFIPPLSLTLDNAAMIARLGYEQYKRGIKPQTRMSADTSLAF